jgi:hypothetical protein
MDRRGWMIEWWKCAAFWPRGSIAEGSIVEVKLTSARIVRGKVIHYGARPSQVIAAAPSENCSGHSAADPAAAHRSAARSPADFHATVRQAAPGRCSLRCRPKAFVESTANNAVMPRRWLRADLWWRRCPRYMPLEPRREGDGSSADVMRDSPHPFEVLAS